MIFSHVPERYGFKQLGKNSSINKPFRTNETQKHHAKKEMIGYPLRQTIKERISIQFWKNDNLKKSSAISLTQKFFIQYKLSDCVQIIPFAVLFRLCDMMKWHMLVATVITSNYSVNIILMGMLISGPNLVHNSFCTAWLQGDSLKNELHNQQCWQTCVLESNNNFSMRNALTEHKTAMKSVDPL